MRTAPCDCCGKVIGAEPTPVTDRETGEAGELYLCAGCLARPGRSWRLRWEDGPAPTVREVERGGRVLRIPATR